MIDFDKILEKEPQVTFFPDWETKGEAKGRDLSGIKVLSYEGAPLKGQPTKVFAHLGYPERMDGPCPAVVLVHGGGGHPEDIWIKKWNERGFAAISMDTTGFFPQKPIPYLYEGFAEGLERKLSAPFYEEGFTVGPTNSEMGDMDLPIEDEWMYHAVSAVILAHNILRADPKIDSEKIGISGISWGGVITSITIGYDHRFAFAVPIYGSGYLSCGLAGLNRVWRRSGAQRWFAERRFSDLKMPVLWLCWNDDCCFSVQSNSMSYLETKDNNPATRLSMLHQMGHSHEKGYRPEESFWFGKEIIEGRSIPKVDARKEGSSLRYECDAPLKAVRLFYITEQMTYILRDKYHYKNSTFMEQEWQILDLDPAKNSASLPEETKGYYLEFTLENDLVLTTAFYE